MFLEWSIFIQFSIKNKNKIVVIQSRIKKTAKIKTIKKSNINNKLSTVTTHSSFTTNQEITEKDPACRSVENSI